MAAARARITPASTMPCPPKPLIRTSVLLATVRLPLGLRQRVEAGDDLGPLGVHKLAPWAPVSSLLRAHLVPLGLADERLLHPVHHGDAVLAQLVGPAVEGGALGDD